MSHYFIFETSFVENKTIFKKTEVPFFTLKRIELVLLLKTQHFHRKMPCEKLML